MRALWPRPKSKTLQALMALQDRLSPIDVPLAHYEQGRHAYAGGCQMLECPHDGRAFTVWCRGYADAMQDAHVVSKKSY